jgi:hypothetical protein
MGVLKSTFRAGKESGTRRGSALLSAMTPDTLTSTIRKKKQGVEKSFKELSARRRSSASPKSSPKASPQASPEMSPQASPASPHLSLAEKIAMKNAKKTSAAVEVEGSPQDSPQSGLRSLRFARDSETDGEPNGADSGPRSLRFARDATDREPDVTDSARKGGTSMGTMMNVLTGTINGKTKTKQGTGRDKSTRSGATFLGGLG